MVEKLSQYARGQCIRHVPNPKYISDQLGVGLVLFAGLRILVILRSSVGTEHHAQTLLAALTAA